MQVLHIPNNRGHDVIEFDRKTGTGVQEAMERFQQIVAEHNARPVTRKAGDRDSHIVKNFDEVEDETTFLLQRQGG